MRIYGLHSGRNNMSRLIARSIMYNSRGKKKSKPKSQTTVPTATLTNESDSIGGILFIVFLYFIIFILLFH